MLLWFPALRAEQRSPKNGVPVFVVLHSVKYKERSSHGSFGEILSTA
jgi:hypothetical protein